MVRRAGLLLAALALAAPGAPALASGSGDAGTSSGQFLKLGVGARASGMGEAASAVADDASALYYNPAALAAVERGSLLLMHAPYLAGTFYDDAAFALRASPNEAVGAMVRYFDGGSTPHTDELGQDLGSVHPNDLAVTVGYAYEATGAETSFGGLKGASVGLAVSYVKSTLVESAHTFSFGFGLLSPWYADRSLRFSLSADNIGGHLTFDQEGDPLPSVWRAGAQWRPAPALVLGADAVMYRDAPLAAAAGGELGLGPLALRAGYNSGPAGQLGGLAGATAGLGLRQDGWSLDYAFVPFDKLGTSHRLSLSRKF